MLTLALATRKGGSGKSTLAIGLALAAIEAGHATRLIETDPLGTLSNWQSRRIFAEPVVEPVYRAAELEPRLAALARSGVTLTIIDTASGNSDAATAAIRQCDLCLIPARPSVADIEATASVLAQARAADRPFAFVLNQAPHRGQRIAHAAQALADEAALAAAGVLAQPFIVMRNDHQDALAAGLSVIEFAPEAKSAEEIRGLWRWVEARLGLACAAQPVVMPPASAQQIAAAPLAVPTMFLPASAGVSLAP